MATKRYTKAKVDAVLRIGAQMANVCFNIGQGHDRPPYPHGAKHTIEQTTMKTMYDLHKQWDEALRALRT